MFPGFVAGCSVLGAGYSTLGCSVPTVVVHICDKLLQIANNFSHARPPIVSTLGGFWSPGTVLWAMKREPPRWRSGKESPNAGDPRDTGLILD